MNVPMQSAQYGAKTTSPLLAVAAPQNLTSPEVKSVRVEGIIGKGVQLKTLVVGSKMPTQLAFFGAKTTRPSLAVVAPPNLASPLMVDETLTQLKALVLGSKMPTQLAEDGAKTTRPSLAIVARPIPAPNLASLLMVDEMLTQLKALVLGSKMPTHLAEDGAKTTRPSLAVTAPANLKSEGIPMVDEMSTQLKA